MRALPALLALGLLPTSVIAQQKQEHQPKKPYTVAVAAVGAEPRSLAVSRALLDHVEIEFQSEGKITISGQPLSGLRSDLANERVWQYGREVKSDVVAVIQFEPGSTEESGQVYIWTAAPFEFAPKKPTLIEAVENKRLRPEQTARIAAVIKQAASRGTEVALELLIYTAPPKSLFAVGGSPAQPTDDKGFGHWIGTQEEGTLPVIAFNEPEYEPDKQEIEVKSNPDKGIVRKSVKFALKKRPKEKAPH